MTDQELQISLLRAEKEESDKKYREQIQNLSEQLEAAKIKSRGGNFGERKQRTSSAAGKVPAAVFVSSRPALTWAPLQNKNHSAQFFDKNFIPGYNKKNKRRVLICKIPKVLSL